MKLHEEFKLYENLWEETSEAPKAEVTVEELTKKYNLSTTVEAALAEYSEPFEIDYDDMVDEWEEDAWDYQAGNHTTIAKSRNIDAFTYEVSVDDVFDKLVDEFLKEYRLLNQLEYTIKRLKKEYRFNNYAARMEPILRELVNDYIELSELCKKNYELVELPYIFVADNLENFFELFYNVFQEEYQEDAINSQY